MSIDVKKKLRKSFNRSFLAKDFESFRSELIQQARIFFPDKIQDFSEASVGGMLVDMAATVGDSLSYYLDHQFRELDPFKAVEPDNIRMHLKNAGVEVYGAAPAVVKLKFSFTVASQKSSIGYGPKRTDMPTLLQGTTVKSFTGISFTTTEDVDFAEVDANGALVCDYEVSAVDTNNIPTTYKASKTVEATSGIQTTETFTIPDVHVQFRKITLANENVSSIISITDSAGDVYYEVNALSQDTVFTAVRNTQSDSLEVRNNLMVTPAPKRFIKTFNTLTKLTTAQFGSGDANTLEDDILPDPSVLALPLYGKKDFSRFSIDPNSLLKTHTLGTAPRNTILTVVYRYGGGLSHNVSANSISEIDELLLEFRHAANPTGALGARQTMTVVNDAPASGGAAAPTLDDFRNLIPVARQSQGRMVTREDLLARIYTMPAQFGRVYRASVVDNPRDPLAGLLYVISLDRNGNLALASDILKKNLSKYLNEFRLISDAVDVLDTQVINFGVRYLALVSQSANKFQVLQDINNRLAESLQKKYFQIDQPIIIDDITNIIINTHNVISLVDLKIFPRAGSIEDRNYSSSSFPFSRSTKNGIIFGPIGSIFELKFPLHDIIGSAS